ncbi:MarC family protein [Candidatus Bathyarchaeota archaeon]|nr:MarC family protein [Candidatus Bathyarchaeota archaeon]RLG95171.1 MAG: hypothetical protein DRO37_03330 [Candidatus Bathyarchaeota archaeon]
MFEVIVSAAPDLIKAVISLFIIVDPLGNLPILVSLTENMNREERKRTFQVATATGIILLLFFALLGEQILILFRISMQSFMIAGGILLLLIAMRMLLTGSWNGGENSQESVGVVPIAIPLLVGPGAITTTILNIRLFGVAITVASVLIVFSIVWLTLRFIDQIHRLLGRSGSLIISRVMALIIAAIAVEYILEGIYGLS